MRMLTQRADQAAPRGGRLAVKVVFERLPRRARGRPALLQAWRCKPEAPCNLIAACQALGLAH